MATHTSAKRPERVLLFCDDDISLWGSLHQATSQLLNTAARASSQCRRSQERRLDAFFYVSFFSEETVESFFCSSVRDVWIKAQLTRRETRGGALRRRSSVSFPRPHTEKKRRLVTDYVARSACRRIAVVVANVVFWRPCLLPRVR